ncbi:putative retrotransposon hot spot protein (RHS) [Trypanosoma cruzi]|uniref:Putative retrotransposon hot spot protein (RHS) n=1 Tax=Trypanosoma cruzi TaxID=5693 RepID=A0A2V2WQ81_TRYCR|nr:putative retrotransposon hot spot protein (RHS) [Trypanosoma cruzi]
MEVREGEPPQSWTYKAVCMTLEKDDGVEQSGAPRLRLMVLTSEKGWPYSWRWKENKSTRDCHVNCEVDRVWRTVKGDLTKWFSRRAKNKLSPRRRLLVGTPWIGNSMAADSYLLYQLLHGDAEKLQVAVYSFGSQSFLFDKTTQAVREYVDTTKSKRVFFFWQL